MNPTLRRSALLLAVAVHAAWAAEPQLNTPELPPVAIVERVLRNVPLVQAAGSQVRAEEANRERLTAGSHEWNARFGSQQRKVYPAGSNDQRFNEWNAALERPLRLYGKAGLDADIGAAGVALAESARGDALHESARALLHDWFVWLRETAAARQWGTQVELLHKQTRAIQRRQQLGDAARLDAVLASGALAQAEAQLAQAQVRAQTAAETLRQRYPELPLEMPARLSEPMPPTGSQTDWVNAMLNHSHELALARGSSARARLQASRSNRDRLPDPTLGLQVSRERGGEEHIIGAYISIPLPGQARRASADSAMAQADAAEYMAANVTRRITTEAATLYQAAQAAVATWQAGRLAAARQEEAASMSARAYQLGEGNLNELLTARRLANEAALTASLMQLDALELNYRLQLDAHTLWALDEEAAEHSH